MKPFRNRLRDVLAPLIPAVQVALITAAAIGNGLIAAAIFLNATRLGALFLPALALYFVLLTVLLAAILRRRELAGCMAVLAIVGPLICPAPWEAGHTVLGRLPAFALGVWFGSFLQKDAAPPKWLAAGLLTLPLLRVTAVPRLAVLLAVAAVLFWAVYAAGQQMPARFCPALRRLAGWCYGVYLVHHVLLTLVFLRFVARFNLPLAGMFPVYLAVSFALAAVLTAVSRPLGKAIKKLA